jgi:hypothetical protein
MGVMHFCFDSKSRIATFVSVSRGKVRIFSDQEWGGAVR